MRILYVASEVAPFAKTGGLADVAGALPEALSRLGQEVKVVMPKYAIVNEKQWKLTSRGDITVKLGVEDYSFTVWSGNLPGTSVEVLFLSNPVLFNRSGLYQEKGKDYPDNLKRFSAFSRAALEVPGLLNWSPDILHANDWQTALTFAYVNAHLKKSSAYKNIGMIFTIHNLGYPGLFPVSEFPLLGLPSEYYTADTLEFYGKVNLLKAGLVFSEILTTVSPTYSREIQSQEFGHGIEGILQARRRDLFGIINGVDYRQWDPSHDSYLLQPYDRRHLEGKRVCKLALQKECKLPMTGAPVVGMITRLTEQKGVDLVIEVMDEIMRLDVQFVILGTGDPDVQRHLQQAMQRYPDKLSVHLAFDEALAHRIEAGADMFLMPSRYEPCGLNQLYSLRYGTIPIVRRTGGLADTVVEATPSNILSEKATGFMFESASGRALLTSLQLALQFYKDRNLWERMMRTAMAVDFSWDRSAREYINLYEKALAKGRMEA
jgi:starch synthase